MSKLPFTAGLIETVVEQGKAVVEDTTLSNKSKGEKLYRITKQLAQESRFTPVQDVLIDVIVAFRTELVLEKRPRMPDLPEMIEKTKELIGERYSDNEDLVRILLESLPTNHAVRNWTLKAEFKTEVERRMRDDSLFSQDKRAVMIQNLFNVSLKDKNMKAAEMWLKMSGDLTPHVENKDKTLKEFEEFNTALWTKKKEQIEQ